MQTTSNDSKRTHVRFLYIAILAVGLAWSAPSDVSAQYSQGGIDSVRFDAHLSLGWYSGVGAGFRADIPIVSKGLVRGVSDDLSLTVGADLLYFYHRYYKHHGYDGVERVGFYPLVGVQWNFYVKDWSFFPELGLVFLLGANHDRFWDNGIASPFLGIGARYHFNPSNALLLRISWPAGFQVGITF